MKPIVAQFVASLLEDDQVVQAPFEEAWTSRRGQRGFTAGGKQYLCGMPEDFSTLVDLEPGTMIEFRTFALSGTVGMLRDGTYGTDVRVV